MTRRIPGLFAGGLLWLVLLLAGPTPSVAAEPAIHVSPQGDDRWSGRVAASTPDGRDGPVATLARAVEEARKRGLHLILLRGGTHRLTDTVTLGPEDSGLRIAAFPGETPVLSGGEVVAGFKAERDGVVSAPLAREPGLDVTRRRGAAARRAEAAPSTRRTRSAAAGSSPSRPRAAATSGSSAFRPAPSRRPGRHPACGSRRSTASGRPTTSAASSASTATARWFSTATAGTRSATAAPSACSAIPTF
ncbi:hypothetical protein [Azospirillum baldaniorum]|uniref:hypothetical protein n=1 Tax=Azospirillum baldaniorum TaxID=1064539 RepID=UPI001FCAFE04|nr:hypothetical protein [Azospirillum baldaniorum]